MATYDLVMLIVLAIAVLFGAWKGLAWQVASLASIFASFFLACRFRGPVAEMIDASAPWNTFLAMLLIYLGCSLAIWLAFRYVSSIIEKVKLKEFDNHAGAVLGLCRGVVWCVIITLFAVTLLGHEQQQKIIQSRSGHYIALLLDRAHPVMPEELHEVLAPYIHALDSTLDEDERSAHAIDDGRDDQTVPRGVRSATLPGLEEQATQAAREAAGDAVDGWLRKFDDVRVSNRTTP